MPSASWVGGVRWDEIWWDDTTLDELKSPHRWHLCQLQMNIQEARAMPRPFWVLDTRPVICILQERCRRCMLRQPPREDMLTAHAGVILVRYNNTLFGVDYNYLVSCGWVDNIFFILANLSRGRGVECSNANCAPQQISGSLPNFPFFFFAVVCSDSLCRAKSG